MLLITPSLTRFALADAVKAQDVVSITLGNEVWHTPASDTSGVGHALHSPAEPLWGVAADKNGVVYFIYRKEPDDVLARLTASGGREDLATLPVRGSVKYTLGDMAVGPTGNIYLVYKQDNATNGIFITVGADRKVSAFQPLPAPIIGSSTIAVSSKDEIYIAAEPARAQKTNLFRAAPGSAPAKVGEFDQLLDIGFVGGDVLWGSFRVGLEGFTVKPISLAASGTTAAEVEPFQSAPVFPTGGIFGTDGVTPNTYHKGNQQLIIYNTANSQTVTRNVKELLATFGRPPGMAIVPGVPQPVTPPCRQEDWIPNCIIIERGDVEINGLQYRKKGEAKASKIEKHPKSLEPRLFSEIQGAIDFVGLDCNSEVDLSFRSFDTVHICASTIDPGASFVIPPNHRILSDRALASITIRGAGQERTRLRTSFVEIASGGSKEAPNIIQDLIIDGGQVKAKTATRVKNVTFRGGQERLTAFEFKAYGEMSDCLIDLDLQEKSQAVVGLGSELKITNVFFSNVDEGVYVLDGLTASNLTFSGPDRDHRLIYFQGSGGKIDSVFANAGYIELSGASNTSITNFQPLRDTTGSLRLTVKNGENVAIRRCVVKNSPFDGIDILASRSVTIASTSVSNSTLAGLRISLSRGITLIGGESIFNTRAGIFIADSDVAITNSYKIHNNHIGISKNEASEVTCLGCEIAANGSDGFSSVVVRDAGNFETRTDPDLPPSGIAKPDVFADSIIFGNGGAGIRLQGGGSFDFGGGEAGSLGGNIIAGNGTLDLVNETGSRIAAKNNIWDNAEPAQILTRDVSPGAGVDVTPVMPLKSISFAQFFEAPSFQSSFTAVNPSRTKGAATLLAMRDSAGKGMNVKLNGSESPGGLQPGAVPPLGARFFSTDAATSALNVGSLTAASGRKLAGTVLFSGPLGVAGVGQSEPLTQFIAPVERSTSRSTNSGAALVNTGDKPVRVLLRLRDSVTGVVREAAVDLAAFGQAARMIDELFTNLPSEFTGTLSGSAATPIGATVVRTSPKQYATLPVTGTGSKRLLYAQFGEANGLTSTMTFVNPSLDKTAAVTARLFDDNGKALTVRLGETDRAGLFTFTVPAQGSVTFSTPGTSSTVKTGSVVVESSEPIGGTILFGGSFGTAGVGASQALSSFIAPAEQTSEGGVVVGLAMMNPESWAVTIKLILRDESGTPIEGGTIEITLPAQGHLARFLAQLYPALDLKNFRGTITGEVSGGNIGATVVRQSATELATLPVAEIVP